MKFTRILTIIILIFFIGNFCYAGNTTSKEDWPAYLLTLFIGFGTGHFYLGDSKGMVFLIGDLVGYGMEIGGLLYIISQISSMDPYSEQDAFAAFDDAMIGYSIIIGGSLIILVVRIWEIVDVFRAVERARDAGKIASLQPYIDIQPTKAGFGLSLKF